MAVDFYTLSDGSRPAADFISSIEADAKAELLMKLDLLDEYGEDVKEPYLTALKEGIYSITGTTLNGITSTVYLFFTGDGRAILTHGRPQTPFEAFKRKQLKDLEAAASYEGQHFEYIKAIDSIEAAGRKKSSKNHAASATAQEIEKAKRYRTDYQKQCKASC